jgi:hypothetical protein
MDTVTSTIQKHGYLGLGYANKTWVFQKCECRLEGTTIETTMHQKQATFIAEDGFNLPPRAMDKDHTLAFVRIKLHVVAGRQETVQTFAKVNGMLRNVYFSDLANQTHGKTRSAAMRLGNAEASNSITMSLMTRRAVAVGERLGRTGLSCTTTSRLAASPLAQALRRSALHL